MTTLFSTQKRREILLVVILLAVVFVPLFSHLGHLPIRLWDESRLVCNAMEMIETEDLIVTQFNGSPEMWNTKPPLMIWLQAASIKIFGAAEFAVRFPSALAGLATCVLLFWFGRRLGSAWLGLAAVLVLVTSPGYTGEHGTRTGDYDALLTLFTTMGLLFWFLWCEAGKTKYLYWFFMVLMLGVMTKGVAGLLFLPAVGMFALLQKRALSVLRVKHFYFGLLIFLIPVAAYYLGREALNPGYLEAVYNNELGGRYVGTLENHSGGFWYYWELLVNGRFGMWYILVPCGLALGLWSADQLMQKLTLFLTLSLLSYFLVISSAASKLVWYDVPLYPILAWSVALFVKFIVDRLTQLSLSGLGLQRNVLPFIFIFYCF